MNFFRGLNKEQWTALVAVALSCLLPLLGFGGGGASALAGPKGPGDEPYVALKTRYVDRPDLRDKKEREFAVITLKSGKPMENVAEITAELPDYVFYKDKQGNRRRISRADILGSLLYNNTNEKQYQIDTENIRSGSKEIE